ncbi:MULTISPECIES: hypothetical protein [unclassified Leptolyngbya]|uniref:hypothetical protein n=1 Tax=unclassified Leptolyngbya TaxID=2650499 RepID=UPI001685340B|nr:MULTISPECIES: hypothetical protein [unclassified Leptolyngbya]MBD1911643.1 hypothetical protein [Leptolyngbya sp. FACHB-8]MBD2157841.1 hypothetical protein [Leptolyngbya sp. FACHB-16]
MAKPVLFSRFRRLWQGLVVLVMALALTFPVGSAQALNVLSLPAQSPLYLLTQGTAGTNQSGVDLDAGIDAAQQAPDQIYEGLDKTKKIIGKTEKRNEIIQEGRDKASDKWQSLADKARAAQNSDDVELSPVEEHTLKHLTNSKR